MPTTPRIETHRRDEISEPYVLRQKSNDKRRKEGPKIDAHVEDRKAGVASLILVWVKLAHHGTDVGFQQPGTDSNQDQTSIKAWQAADRHRIVSTGDDDATYQDRPPGSQNSIRQPATDERQIPNRRDISRVDDTGILFVEAESALYEALRHIERQDCAHAVVAEALPHFCEEQSRQSTRMSKKSSIRKRSGTWSGGVYWCAHSDCPQSEIVDVRNWKRLRPSATLSGEIFALENNKRKRTRRTRVIQPKYG